MSLSAKVKDLLSSGDSKDTSTAETTHHTPGSFPTEDLEPSETREGYSKGHEHEHNKLHKPNDPRGFTEDDSNPSRGHAYKDSGVGLAETNDPTSYKPSQEPISERRDEPLERHNEPLDRTAASTTAGGLGDSSNFASQDGPSGSAVPSTEEHPYWGDLPRNTGVHNTVIGHGSPEDEAQRHRAVHAGATEPSKSSTLESGTFPTTHRRDRDDTTASTNPHDAQRQAQENPQERTHGSRFNEGVAGAGAGAAGTAALGAHELNKKRHPDETPKNVDQTADRTQPEQHQGRSFPLLGKDHKDTHHSKEVKEEKHAKEPKKEHESKLGALFHRHGSKDENEPRTEQEPVQDKHHGHKTAPAVAAAGAGTAATYAATRDRHDDNTQPDTTTSRYSGLPATRDENQHSGAGLNPTRDHTTQSGQPTTAATQQPHQQEGSHRGTGLATGAAAGLGAGALASHYGQRSDTDRTGPDSRTGYDAQSYDPTNRSARDPIAQSSQQQATHQDRGLAQGTAVGLGAGALASHSGQHHSGTGQHSALDSNQGYDAQRSQPANFSHKDPTGHTYQQQDSHKGAGLAAGTVTGLSAEGLASNSSRDYEAGSGHYSGTDPNRGFESQAGQSADRSTRDPTLQSHHQQDSHRGAGLGAGALASRSGHDHHQSGADQHSGLESNRGFESQGNQPADRSTRDPTTQSYQQEGSHRGAGLATGTAAGLGAGALASHELGSRQGNEQHTADQSSRGYQPSTTGTGSVLGNTSTSAHDTSRNEPLPGSHNQSQLPTEGTHHHTLADNANAGKYNTLASGTPSGVRYDDDDLDTNRSSQRTQVDPLSHKKDEQYGTKAAGLGTAAALSRNRDEKSVESEQNRTHRTEPQTERQFDRQTETQKPIAGAVASKLSNNKPVIHKCQKCGEDNDISQYFTSNSPGRI